MGCLPAGAGTIPALIIDGQNRYKHQWLETTVLIKRQTRCGGRTVSYVLADQEVRDAVWGGRTDTAACTPVGAVGVVDILRALERPPRRLRHGRSWD